jgi:hypothetical protein
MVKELSFWSFVVFALVHLVTVLANSSTLRKESGNHFQLALKMLRRGGIRGWSFSISFYLFVLSFVVMLAAR